MSSSRAILRGLVPAPWVAVLLVALLVHVRAGAAPAAPAPRDEPILPIPAEHGQIPRKVALGQRLFADPRLSRDGTVSCASCHGLAIGGVDRLPRSKGVGGAIGRINAPTVYNSGFNLSQFWDGRVRTLEEQVDGPLHDETEMASDWPRVIERLNVDEDYRERFEALYADGITAINIRDAIASYERTLITPGSAFDRWLMGDDDALGEQAVAGYRLFKSYGCVACHQGVNIGGNMYQLMGTMGDYFGDRGGELTGTDLGRYRFTGDERDRFYFKVPSLRLAVLTPPYFHDSSAEDLDEAIVMMGKYQLGRAIPLDDVAAIESFLASVVGDHPELVR